MAHNWESKMKRSKWFVVLLALMMLLTACGSSSSIEGNWNVQNEEAKSMVSGLAILGIDENAQLGIKFTADKMSFTIDGKDLYDVMLDAAKKMAGEKGLEGSSIMAELEKRLPKRDQLEFKYKIEGDKITITSPDKDPVTNTYKLEGDTLTISSKEVGGFNLVLKRAK